MNPNQQINSINSVKIINPETSECSEEQNIFIENRYIASISSTKNDSTKGALDGSGLYAIPGLIDSHVHALNFLYEEIPGLFDLKWVFDQQKKNLKAYIRSGVTTVRDLGSALKLIRKTSFKALKLDIESPRIFFAGPILTVPKGYPYFIERVPAIVNWIAGPLRIDLKANKDPHYIHQIINKIIRNGGQCIKVAYQSVKYDDDQSEIPIISLPNLREIVDYAHKQNIPVAVHCCYRKDFQELMDATDIQYNTHEHLIIDEPLNNDEVKRFAERNIPISTTLMTYGIIDHIDRFESLLQNEPERFEKKPFKFLNFACKALRSGEEVSHYIGRNCIDTGSKFMRENLKKLVEVGVKILCGTDSAGAITPPGCMHWELSDMIRAGMSHTEALRSATTNPADALGYSNLGRLEKGKIADVVLLRKNPLENVENIKEVAAVIRDGRLVYESR